MEETGKVVSVNGRLAKVALEQQIQCGHCFMARLCQVHAKERNVEAINEVGAGVGDKVRVVFSPRAVFWSSMLIFALPLISFLVGFTVFSLLLDSQGIPILAGFGFLAGYFLVLSRIDRKYRPLIKKRCCEQ